MNCPCHWKGCRCVEVAAHVAREAPQPRYAPPVRAQRRRHRSANLGGSLCDFRPHDRPVYCVEYYSSIGPKRRELSYRPFAIGGLINV